MDVTVMTRDDGSVAVQFYNGQNMVAIVTVAAPTVAAPQPDIIIEAESRKCVFGPVKATTLSPVVDVINVEDVKVTVSLEEVMQPDTTLRTPFGEVIVGPTDTTLPPPPLP